MFAANGHASRTDKQVQSNNTDDFTSTGSFIRHPPPPANATHVSWQVTPPPPPPPPSPPVVLYTSLCVYNPCNARSTCACYYSNGVALTPPGRHNRRQVSHETGGGLLADGAPFLAQGW